ncbi:MAG: hypothetical protein HDR72_01915 [Ruminococcaceae bacterium]|nr:hypothetical protein [Oscillospiraceae bacterium]
MTDYGIVKFSTKPEPIKIDEYSVWVHTDIKPFEEEIEGEVFTGYTAHMVQYDKDEYLKMQIAENAELAKQITNAQLAICDIYENMEV